MKRCSKCGVEKELNEFSRDRRAKDGHRPDCKECVAIYRRENKKKIAIRMRAYNEKNKEKIAICHRGYYKNNKERIAIQRRAYLKSERGILFSRLYRHKRRIQAKSALSDITTEQWQRIIRSQSSRCNMCGKRFYKSRTPTFDHIIPLSRGGGLTSDNIQALCLSCNSAKNAKLYPQFIQTWTHRQ